MPGQRWRLVLVHRVGSRMKMVILLVLLLIGNITMVIVHNYTGTNIVTIILSLAFGLGAMLTTLIVTLRNRKE